MRCSAGSTGCWPARRRRSPPPMIEVDRLKPRYRDKTVLVGNPVRDEVAKLGELPFPPFDEFAPLKILVTGGSQGAIGAWPASCRKDSRCSTVASPPAAGRPAVPARRHRRRARPLCGARHSGRPHDLYRGHARQAGRRASRHRPRRRLDHRRADRGRPSRDPDPLSLGDRRSPDRQCPRDDARRAAHGRSSRTAFTPQVLARQIEAMADDPVALNNAAARALSVGRPHAARDLADLVERDRRRARAGHRRPRRSARAAGRAAPVGACRHDEGVGHRHRHDPLRRHRRHRHVRHRRGDAPARLQGAGLRRRRRLCRREAAQGGHPGQHRPFRRQSWRGGGGGLLDRDQGQQSRSRRRRRAPSAARPPRRNARRADADAEDRRGRRHPRQDHDDLDGRGVARRRRASTRPSSTAASSTATAPTPASAKATGG